jgi:hypothetical protein
MLCAVKFQGPSIGHFPVVMKQVHVINGSSLFGEVFVHTTRHNDKRYPTHVAGVQHWNVKFSCAKLIKHNALKTYEGAEV